MPPGGVCPALALQRRRARRNVLIRRRSCVPRNTARPSPFASLVRGPSVPAHRFRRGVERRSGAPLVGCSSRAVPRRGTRFPLEAQAPAPLSGQPALPLASFATLRGVRPPITRRNGFRYGRCESDQWVRVVLNTVWPARTATAPAARHGFVRQRVCSRPGDHGPHVRAAGARRRSGPGTVRPVGPGRDGAAVSRDRARRPGGRGWPGACAIPARGWAARPV